MESLNRILVSLMTLAWIAVLAALLVMVWSPERAISIDGARFSVLLHVALTPAIQIVASVILVALIAFVLAVLLVQVVGPRPRYTPPDDLYRRLETRVSELEGRVAGRRDPESERPRLEARG